MTTATAPAWHLIPDAAAFLDRAAPLLRTASAAHTVVRSVALDVHRDAARYGARTPYFASYEEADGTVRGLALWTPPYAVLAGPLPEDAGAALAETLHAAELRPEGVLTTPEAARAYAHRWESLTGTLLHPRRTNRLHALGTLAPHRLPGRARPATEADADLLTAWFRGFSADVDERPPSDPAAWTADILGKSTCLLWETPDGTPVAMAARTPATDGSTRVTTVYTPPAHRRHGYAAAVTTAVTEAALAGGCTEILLNTDAANPTSNALYRRLGYEPVRDFQSWARE
ncbi:GNAT family N-acetyltransferase [Streptomyces sp. NPDC047046]|uniref:GNAT family N-acetyltransferase n=1 Tax=Streptomyces sp. NPDC047046 TaxID=3155378 RepID=UPI0033D6F738